MPGPGSGSPSQAPALPPCWLRPLDGILPRIEPRRIRPLGHPRLGHLWRFDIPDLAIDPRYIPLGTPVWLATTRPNSSVPLNRLMAAQDTGTAIKGAVRADFFWGFGREAGETAGRMKQSGRLWVLLPNEVRPPAGMDIR